MFSFPFIFLPPFFCLPVYQVPGKVSVRLLGGGLAAGVARVTPEFGPGAGRQRHFGR